MHSDEHDQCSWCNGTGRIKSSPAPFVNMEVACDQCNGTGKYDHDDKKDHSQVLPEGSSPIYKNESDRLTDFFFPKNEDTGSVKCECGLDSVGGGEKHYSYCPKGKL